MADADDIDPGAICARGTLSSADVAVIRRGYYKDGLIGEGEADALFALEQNCRTQPPEWGVLFVEALAEYLVHQVKPAGYLTADNAAWLTERIASAGKVETRNEFNLLVKVLEEARWAPGSLSALALGQVRDGITEGTGPLRLGASKPSAGVVTANDVVQLRRILYAGGGDGNIAVTRAEAEVLMDIGDAADESLSDPSWIDLYTKAIANHLMAAAGHIPPPREEALLQEAWLEAEPDLGGFLGDMVHSGLTGIWAACRTPSLEDIALARVEAETRAMLVSEEITAPEAKWLADRIARDGRISDAERALLGFIKHNSPKIDPALNRLLESVA